MYEIWGVTVYPISILLAMLVNIVIGMIWYGPLFGKTWMKLTNKKTDNNSMKPKDLISSLLLALLIATGLNSVLQFAQQVSGLSDLVNLIATPLMITFTLVLAPVMNPVIWEGRNFKLVALNFACTLTTYIAMSAVLLIWI